MFIDAQEFEKTFNKALKFQDYIATGSAEQKKRWQDVYNAASITSAQKTLLQSFTRQMNVLLLSGVWCGDCIEQGPLLARIAEGCDKIDLRFIDRDSVADLAKKLTINGGERVPVALFAAEDFAVCSCYGDRTISRYRNIAKKQSGASCSTGLLVPETYELAATLADWLVEVERIQLMLRLSTRLRKKYND
jgi:hypothetical protein